MRDRRAKSHEEMMDLLKSMGVKKAFKPQCEKESGDILLRVRQPAGIVDGQLVGAEIDVYDASTFRVWTPRVKKANALAQKHGLQIHLMDGEVELFVPVTLADVILPQFRALVKRQLSLKQLEVLKKARERTFECPNFTEKPCAEGGSGVAKAGNGVI